MTTPSHWWIVDPWLTVVEGSFVTSPFPIEGFPGLEPDALAMVVAAHLQARHGDIAVVDVPFHGELITVTVSATDENAVSNGFVTTIAAANSRMYAC